jgi:dolichol-phosphate mannosyltransferase
MPTYQEAGDVVEALTLVRRAAPEVEVLVVDDGSPDGTADLAENVAKELGGINVLRRPAKSGLGAAYRAGFAWAATRGYDAVVEMDADLSHDPYDLPGLLAVADTGADLVIGSRYVAGGRISAWSWWRRVLSRVANRYAAAMLRLGVRDATSGFRVFKASTLAAIDLEEIRADGYVFQIEMVRLIDERGGRIIEAPITFTDRARGRSKMSGRIVVEAMALVTWWGIEARWLERWRRRPKSVPKSAQKPV